MKNEIQIEQDESEVVLFYVYRKEREETSMTFKKEKENQETGKKRLGHGRARQLTALGVVVVHVVSVILRRTTRTARAGCLSLSLSTLLSPSVRRGRYNS